MTRPPEAANMPSWWSSRTGSDEIARHTRHFVLSTYISRFTNVLIQSVPKLLQILVAGARYVLNLDTLCIPFRSELIHCAA